jgi:hypothetical protein
MSKSQRTWETPAFVVPSAFPALAALTGGPKSTGAVVCDLEDIAGRGREFDLAGLSLVK